MELKNRALYQYGVGGGGVVDKKKDFGNTPCKVWMVGVGSEFFNLVTSILCIVSMHVV